jgi:raffinose/stachyose/melibiose transport system permease protein
VTSVIRQSEKRPRTANFGPNRTNWPATIILAVGSLLILVPLYVTISVALKSDAAAKTPGPGSGLSFPWPLHFENFGRAWTLTKFPVAFAISMGITIVAVAGAVLLCSMASYALSRNMHRRAFRWSFILVLGSMFIPFPVIALAQVKITSLVGLDNPIGVAILHILFGLSFNLLLYTAFLRSLPKEMEESGRLDGAGTWMVFRRIIFPLLGPMNATVAIFAFLSSWNDFVMPSLITSNASLQTIPVLQNIFNNQLSSANNVAFSSYLMAMAPSLIGYLIAQRWVVAGVMRGAVK